MVLVAILGKSGCGKSTTEASLEKIGYNRIISYTTRKIRDGEVNHREYHFINENQFQKLIDMGIMVEWATYNGNLYGSPKPVGNEKNVIVVEPDGLAKLVELYGRQVVSVYIDTPNEVIEDRLNKRNNTTDRGSRKIEDNSKFDGIEDKVDIIVDGRKPTSAIVIDILNEIMTRGN